MGKTAKRPNRRMKKAVRRTLGALCLISAITVAAIPIPENLAYDPASDIIASYTSLGIGADSSEALTVASLSSSGKISAQNKSGKTYVLNTVGNITYLDWQFDYSSASNFTDGFITGYNSKFSRDSLDLSNNVLFSDYVYVDKSAFEEFYKKVPYLPDRTSFDVTLYNPTSVTRTVTRLGSLYTLPEDPDNWNRSGVEYKFFSNYFKQDADDYEVQYQDYLDGNGSQPAQLERCLFDSELYDEQSEQYQYLCEQILGGVNKSTMSVEPTTIYTYDGGTRGSKDIYVFKTDLPSTTRFSPNGQDFYYSDNLGYLTSNYIMLVGIKESALKDVNNITDVTLGSNMKYICDSAFENSSMLSTVDFTAGAESVAAVNQEIYVFLVGNVQNFARIISRKLALT